MQNYLNLHAFTDWTLWCLWRDSCTHWFYEKVHEGKLKIGEQGLMPSVWKEHCVARAVIDSAAGNKLALMSYKHTITLNYDQQNYTISHRCSQHSCMCYLHNAKCAQNQLKCMSFLSPEAKWHKILLCFGLKQENPNWLWKISYFPFELS